jgi:hypothetical protein
MLKRKTSEPALKKPLRLWPSVVIVMLQVLARFGVPIVVPDAELFAVLGWFFGGLAVVVWWLFFSRALWPERLGALILMIAAMAATSRFLHVSVAQGNMGFQFYFHAIPVLGIAFVCWAVASRRLPDRPRRVAMVATILLACGVFTLLRSKGITGDGAAEFTWRWTETAEERLLAQAEAAPVALASTPAATPEEPPSQVSDDPAEFQLAPKAAKSSAEQPLGRSGDAPTALMAAPAADWPGFRGRNRDGIIPGLRIETDWSATPPVELWRRPIGPGVSSFAVRGDSLYTQEQRGEDEIVACYKVSTGEPVWMHSDTVRFWDSHVGAGPRATPALSDGRVFTLGATGILNALDAGNGSVVWSRNAASDSDAKRPTWGFVSSPLVVDSVVVVHAGALAAYDLATGDLRWIGPAKGSYSSPHLLTLDGVEQILLLSHAGMTSHAPADGTLLWEHPWPGLGIMQPALIPKHRGDLLISMVNEDAMPIGTRRITVANGPGGWTIEERWTSNGMKPSFSPIVVHEGHAFGFDGRILACIDLQDGKRKWKGGRYGSGQLILLPDQDLLLVLSEQGELALVAATPEQFKELARFPAIEGKTWNHPVLVGDVLLVRNGQEMVAFRLAPVRS